VDALRAQKKMRKKYTIQDMRQLAIQKGGKCLSSEYISKNTKLSWKCKHGHVFETTPNSILYSNTWCPTCSVVNRTQKRKLSLSRIREIGNMHDCILQSTEYKNSSTPLSWKCSKGHVFSRTITQIQDRVYSCPLCRKDQQVSTRKKPISYFYEFVKKHEGKIIQVIDDDNFVIKCKEGHDWNSTRAKLLSHSWCVKCSYIKRGNTQKNNIRNYQIIAKKRGGQLLSVAYNKISEKLQWKCKQGHIWFASAGSVQAGSWCPHCSSGLGERICRIYFEAIYKTDFIRAYPKWLINARGNQMELDGFLEEKLIAFEHQGEQHYSTSTKYIRTNDKLTERIEDDKRKAKLCKQHNISLFIIPSILHIVAISDLPHIISKESKRLGIPISEEEISRLEICIDSAYSVDYHNNKLQEIKQYAKDRNGKCISKYYVNDRTKMTFQCSNKHIWESIPKDVLKGHWCRKCAARERADKRKLSITDINKKISGRGRCISKEYMGYYEKLEFVCNNSHHFFKSPQLIKRGSWCPICSKTNT